jgi:hypothetical protein
MWGAIIYKKCPGTNPTPPTPTPQSGWYPKNNCTINGHKKTCHQWKHDYIKNNNMSGTAAEDKVIGECKQHCTQSHSYEAPAGEAKADALEVASDAEEPPLAEGESAEEAPAGEAKADAEEPALAEGERVIIV